jgi:hypothetical protein
MINYINLISLKLIHLILVLGSVEQVMTINEGGFNGVLLAVKHFSLAKCTGVICYFVV